MTQEIQLNHFMRICHSVLPEKVEKQFEYLSIPVMKFAEEASKLEEAAVKEVCSAFKSCYPGNGNSTTNRFGKPLYKALIQNPPSSKGFENFLEETITDVKSGRISPKKVWDNYRYSC